MTRYPGIEEVLRINGYRLKFDDREAYDFLTGLYDSNRMRFSELETWLRQHVSRSPGTAP